MHPDSRDSDRPHRPYRPPLGIPSRGEPRAPATVAAAVVHALFILLILAPTLFVSARLAGFQPLGAGGAGPAGGGGGGNQGTGGSTTKYVPERLRFMRLKTVAPAKPPDPEVKPPVPEIKPPPVEKKPEPEPTPVVDPKAAAATASDSSAVAGSGGGTGTDGTAGSGPGSGGGVGSGVGTGRGSANGPGTGGGDEMVYPPTVVALPILPLPVPGKVRPYRMVAQFDVDSVGNARLVSFNPSRDAGYNRRIREMLLEIRFRPAVGLDGRPVRALAVITAEAM